MEHPSNCCFDVILFISHHLVLIKFPPADADMHKSICKFQTE